MLFVAVLKLTLSPPKSYYEYLVKEVQLLGGKGAKADQYARLVRLALEIVYCEKEDLTIPCGRVLVLSICRPSLLDDRSGGQHGPRPKASSALSPLFRFRSQDRQKTDQT